MDLKLKANSFLKNTTITASKTPKLAATKANILVVRDVDLPKAKKLLKDAVSSWQWKKVSEKTRGTFSFDTKKGKLKLVVLHSEKTYMEAQGDIHHEGLLEASIYSEARESIGSAVNSFDDSDVAHLNVHFYDVEYDQIVGSIVGLEMSFYTFKNDLSLKKVDLSYQGGLEKAKLTSAFQSGQAVGESVNIARYLVDAPSSAKRPEDYAKAVKSHFSKVTDLTVNVWNPERLKKEKMGLMLAVGAGSTQGPRLVHLKYRPKKSKEQPVAFVGKGITFDTGGLNIKTGNFMRLMKKDMGGSASLVGLAHFIAKASLEVPCDFYLALAENSVDSDSFRPGDILTARNGKTVEIDNTDAEGRLVLADALSVASEAKGKDKPACIIDVATLTGATKVGLGTDLAGLYSNDDELAAHLQQCGQLAGDLSWRLPLLPAQRGKLKSDVANLANSSSGHGGGIRAAMFLREFVGGKIPWAHYDIFSWVDGKKGPYRRSGGNGQTVQGLALFVSQMAPE